MIRKLSIIFLLVLILIPEALAQQAAAGGGGGGGNPGWWRGVDTPAFAGGVIRDAYCDIIKYMEGTLGAMLMVIAGIAAFATAALGNMKHGITAVAVGISAFTISAVVSLFFGQLCGGGANAGARIENARIFEQQTIDAPNLDFEQVEDKEDPFDL